MLISPTRSQGHRIAKLAVAAVSGVGVEERYAAAAFQLRVYPLTELAPGAGMKRNAEDSQRALSRANYHNLPNVRLSSPDSRFYFDHFPL